MFLRHFYVWVSLKRKIMFQRELHVDYVLYWDDMEQNKIEVINFSTDERYEA
jgi:hypothetical protein